VSFGEGSVSYRTVGERLDWRPPTPAELCMNTGRPTALRASLECADGSTRVKVSRRPSPSLGFFFSQPALFESNSQAPPRVTQKFASSQAV
jgi:hypothetical protein